MWDIVIPAITGLASGAIGSLLAPWANWGVEKKRLQQRARIELIAEARMVLADPPPNTEFRLMPIYSRIRPYLTEYACIAIEGKPFTKVGAEGITIVSGNSRHSGVNPYAQLVLDELSELESRWNLV
jgi:hypothetical protein